MAKFLFLINFITLVSIAISGQTGWKLQRVADGGDLVAVYFTSAERGWVAGDGGYLASTIDGGKTWTKHDLKMTDDINEIYFRNDDNGYLVAGRKMFLTRDAGRTWQETRLFRPGDFLNGTPEFLSIRFADRRRGLVIGAMINRKNLVVDSLVMRTEDGGETWRRIIVPTKSELLHLDYNGSSHAWIVGDEGVILASTDSGLSWRLQQSGTKLPLYNVDFRDDNEGYVVGKSGTILRTENGGTAWEKVKTAFPETFMRVDFADDKNGWIVGYKGSILRSSDKGRTWIKQESGTSQNLFGLFMAKKFGWAVGADGSLVEFLK
ncbi:MAG: WD40/YVTN/BNR-like repeat-containing protein [Blastocatellia bacterium]